MQSIINFTRNIFIYRYSSTSTFYHSLFKVQSIIPQQDFHIPLNNFHSNCDPITSTFWHPHNLTATLRLSFLPSIFLLEVKFPSYLSKFLLIISCAPLRTKNFSQVKFVRPQKYFYTMWCLLTRQQGLVKNYNLRLNLLTIIYQFLYFGLLATSMKLNMYVNKIRRTLLLNHSSNESIQ